MTPQVGSEWLLAPPLAAVDDAIRRGGLEGHLAALVLRTSQGDISGPASDSRWVAHVRDLLASDPIPAGSLRTQDVATIGIRIALGGDLHRVEGYPALAARELAREALSPAVRVHEDERLLLGLAAGVGAAAPTIAPTLINMLQCREHIITYRGMCLDLWAEALALGSARLTPSLADRAMRILKRPAGGPRPAVTDDDRVALYWLATRLSEAVWQPTDEDLRALESVIAEGRRAALTHEAAGMLPPLDAAMFLDALTWSPSASLARRTALEYVLGVIDTFPTCADILAARGRERPPFVINDEYDVQDLFHALVRPGVPDLVPEDTTPKLAGKWSRLDFTSKATRIGFEIKHVKSIRHAATVREEILIDEATYHEHPYIDTIVAFISDPHRHISNASRPAFERDLSQAITVNGRTVHYFVRVRG